MNFTLSCPPREKDEQQAVRKILKAVGFEVYNTSQARASRIHIGLPDLVLLHPGIGKGGWWEVKRYKDRGYSVTDRSTWVPMPLKAEQAEFRWSIDWVSPARLAALIGWKGSARRYQEAFRRHFCDADGNLLRGACGPYTIRKQVSGVTRHAILARDGHRCRRCGATERLHVDHIKPVSAGGSNEPANLQVLCRTCNISKGNRAA